MPRDISRDAPLYEAANVEATQLDMLRAGDVFEVLDLSGGFAWGIATASTLVGYVDEAVLGTPAADAGAA